MNSFIWPVLRIAQAAGSTAAAATPTARMRQPARPVVTSSLEAPRGDTDVEAPLAGGPYDVVIVDGVPRLSCLEVAPRCLASGGVVVLDDAERAAYAAARERLAADGFLPA
jgi:predicted O-methyltransferase YrrM